MSRLRLYPLLGLATAFVLLAQGCEDAQRQPVDNGNPTAGSGGTSTPTGTGGATGTGGSVGGPGGAAGTGGGSVPPRPDAGPGQGIRFDAAVNACPPNASGTPCGGGGTPMVCVDRGDGGQSSGCICLQMMWLCGSLPGGA